MIRFEGGLFFLLLALDVFCVIDLIQTREDEVRNLPKIAWLAAGRPQGGGRSRSAYERAVPAYPEYDRPGRAAGLTPESDEEFLRRIRERAEEQRRKAAEEKKRRDAQQRGSEATDRKQQERDSDAP